VGDIVTDSMSPGAMGEMGWTTKLLQGEPRGHLPEHFDAGESGPHHRFKGVGHHINALAGYCSTTGWPDSDPTMIFPAYSDFIAPGIP